jgi:hypothetical protein
MPLNSESLPTYSRQEFCRSLKSARESRGITLAAIERATKVPAYMFAALERNDLRRWPKGLFRRSFFRDYVRMIGLPVAETCAEFVRLFPDDANSVPASPVTATEAIQAQQVGDVRLVLDAGWHPPGTSALLRFVIALLDATAIVFAAVIAWLAGLERPETTAIVGLVYFFLATVLLGESPAKWVLSRRQPIAETLRRRPAVLSAAWARGIDGLKQLFRRASSSSEHVDEPEPTGWLTDARSVGDGPTNRLRVRIKVPQ